MKKKFLKIKRINRKAFNLERDNSNVEVYGPTGSYTSLFMYHNYSELISLIELIEGAKHMLIRLII
jgi:hypothetical protein